MAFAPPLQVERNRPGSFCVILLEGGNPLYAPVY